MFYRNGTELTSPGEEFIQGGETIGKAHAGTLNTTVSRVHQSMAAFTNTEAMPLSVTLSCS